MASFFGAEDGRLQVSVHDNLAVTTPAFVKYYLRRRVGGVVYDDDAVPVTKCAAS